MLVLDEADLLLSYGYEEDVQALAPHVPRSTQVRGSHGAPPNALPAPGRLHICVWASGIWQAR